MSSFLLLSMRTKEELKFRSNICKKKKKKSSFFAFVNQSVLDMKHSSSFVKAGLPSIYSITILKEPTAPK